MKTIKNIKTAKRMRLKKKIRAKIFGTSDAPRLSVFRSNSHIYAQLIDDNTAKTIVSASDVKLKGKNVEKAIEVGKIIAKDAISKKISKIVFDRNGFKFTGRIKALADSAREAGLNF
jgi:large subunit ribosomal protein L18